MRPITSRYLARLGCDQPPPVTVAGLAQLQLRHLINVPFENLDVWSQRPVTVDPQHAISKIVDHNRGGWCFELNGAFAELLREVGFDVLVLGASTLLDGPSDLVDHMLLEVQLDEPYLVDVGFGSHSPIAPIPLHATVAQQPHATYELLASPKGTTLAWDDGGTPSPLCRFKRVAHDYADFAGASERLQNDPESLFRTSPFATKLLDEQGSRLTWSDDQLERRYYDGTTVSTPVRPAERAALLAADFGIVGFEQMGGPASYR